MADLEKMGARPYLMYFGEETETEAALAEVVSALGAFVLRSHSQLEVVIQRLEEAPPRVLLVELHRVGASALELLGTLEALRLRVPVLMLASNPLPAELPLDFSAFLGVVGPRPTHRQLHAAVLDQVEVAATVLPGPLFRVSDYLQLASAFAQSVDLQLRSRKGDLGHVEIIGGDLWNVYSDGGEGPEELAPMLLESPDWVRAVPLTGLPVGRQIRESGLETIRRAAQAALGEPPQGPAVGQARPTGLRLVAGAKGKEVAVSDSAAFDRLFNGGLEAALARDYRTAIERFGKALELRPDDARVTYNLDLVRRKIDG